MAKDSSWFFFDDYKVQRYIDEAMRNANTHSSFAGQLNQSWVYLYMKRQYEDPHDNDRELAAAEHYMYARWQTCSGETTDGVMRILTLGYDPIKLLLLPVSAAAALIGKKLWTRPSFDSLRWGMRGCEDGFEDREGRARGAFDTLY